MARASQTLTGSQGFRDIGVVSGFVLKMARQSAGLTQEQLAEILMADVTTVQGWESGRRPLAAVGTGAFLRLCDRLSRLGAPPATARCLREAVEADLVLSAGIEAGGAWTDPESHPLAAKVHRWSLTNLILWPLVGRMPQHLHDFATQSRRRGPTPRQPVLVAEDRTRFFDHLLVVADQARRPGESLLRRQAVYLLAFDNRTKSVDWLRTEWDRAARIRPRDRSITELLRVRSASVALAVGGDRTRLYDLVSDTTDHHAEVANLNYWAHWIGESDEEQTDDSFMLTTGSRPWSGHRLLAHLIERLDPTSPHLPLTVCTLSSLLASRPVLLDGQPKVRAALADALGRLGVTDDLSRTERTQITGLRYAIRIADR